VAAFEGVPTLQHPVRDVVRVEFLQNPHDSVELHLYGPLINLGNTGYPGTVSPPPAPGNIRNPQKQ
jgi:hypothetical protein